jgi:hypothetical protein
MHLNGYHRNTLFNSKIRIQGSEKLPTHYMLNDHVQNLNRNNSQKNIHTIERADVTTSTVKKGCHPGSKSCKNRLMISKAI